MAKASQHTATLASKRQELARLQKEVFALRQRIHELHSALFGQPIPGKVHPSEYGQPRVTDHAVIRFLERVHGINVESLKRRLLTEDVLCAMDDYKTFHPIDNEYVAVIHDKQIVTIMPTEWTTT